MTKVKKILVAVKLEDTTEMFEFTSLKAAEMFLDDLQRKYGDLEYDITTGEAAA